MYAPVDPKPDLPSLEQRVLRLWAQTRAFELLRVKNRGGPRWSFLDGPITANNPMGVHHAWGRSLKDMYQRFHAMCGQDQRFQNGFDCQGLWVEVEVEKQLGFSSKQDIEAYGVDRFVEACKARVRTYSQIQTEQSIRLGYWMDWDNSYYTMSDENNYAIWEFLEKCHRRGALYRGLDSMPWCPRCEVGLSEMEMHEGYRWVQDLSVFLRFPIRGRDQEALLVWTTTPWTLTSNVAAAVHPEMSYLRVRQGGWTYYVGKENWENPRRIEVEEVSKSGKRRRLVQLRSLPELLGRLGEVTVLGEVSGSALVGLEYDGPFDELEPQRARGGYPYGSEGLEDRAGVTCHRVIPWEEVTGDEGTGVVHVAPGCGKEDFLLGRQHGLVAISPIDESGRFYSSFEWLAGRPAHEVAPDIAAALAQKGCLIGTETYPHRYAHCWRCGTPVLYRLVDEWFVSMAWRQEIAGTLPQIRWIPDYGEQRELDWLRNMGDWMISKKRYWGLALPIWRCDRHAAADPAERCDWFDVVGSRAELQRRAIQGWEEFDGHSPHRPWVDAVKLRCQRCGGPASRIPDVGNPWLDAGIVPYSTLGYSRDPEEWARWFPADLVLESFPGQFRNWFYAMLAMSAMMQEDRWADRRGGTSQVVPPFRTLLGYALVLDEEGREMHKSLGNAIEFNAAAETVGADVMRYIFAAQNPTNNLRFPDISPDRRSDLVHRDQEVVRTLLTLWNCYSFYVTYAEVDRIEPGRLEVPHEQRSELDRWILAKLQLLVGAARERFGEYRIHQLMGSFEEFLEDLSNWYLRRSRRRFWKSESDSDKLSAYATLFEVLECLCRVMAPVLPFLTEEIYQNLVRSVSPGTPVSVHLLSYPEVDSSRIDEPLVARIGVIVRYRNLGLALRNQAGLKVRQPLARMLVCPADDQERATLESASLRDQLLDELNVKRLELIETTEGLVEAQVRPNFKSLGPRHGPLMKQIQAALRGADAAEVERALGQPGGFVLDVGGQRVALEKDDVEVVRSAPPGLVFAFDGGGFAALDTTLSPGLVREGIARDFVRGVQNRRKALELDVVDRIRLRFRAPEPVRQAIEEWEAYIRRETLAVELRADESLGEGGHPFKVGGSPVSVAVERAGGA